MMSLPFAASGVGGLLRRASVWLLIVLAGGAAATASGGKPGDPWAGWRTTRFLTLDVSNGLPHATTTAIVQASDGVMWIGTRGGLARYDGQRITAFRQSSREPNGLPDNYIRALMPLTGGGVLVGTNVGGAVRFDPAINGFRPIRGPEGVGAGARILSFAPDGHGGALIASDHGAYRYNARADRIESMMDDGPAGRDLAKGAFAVYRDANGTILAGGNKGLFVRRAGTHYFVRAATPDIGDVWAITRDARGRLWVGTGAKGVAIQDRDGRFVQPSTLSGDAPAIGHRTIRAFVRGADGVMWVATDGMGLVRVDADGAFTVRTFRNSPGNPGSLGGDAIRALTIDRTGQLWVATEIGASHTAPDHDAIFTINAAMPDPRRSLADGNVHGIMVDHRDRIWIGLSNGLIDRIDRADGVVRHMRLSGRHAGQDVKAFVERGDGTVLAGGRGVIAIDPQTLANRQVVLPDIGDLPVISLAYAGQRLLIGTYQGLFVWDENRRLMRHYQHADNDPASIANNEIINIVAQPDGRPWIATPGGISRFDPDAGRFVTFRNRPSDPTSLPQNYSGSIVRSGDALWVGTYGGVARGLPVGNSWRFRAITEAKGLANDNVASLLADRGGRIWAASASGISVIDPQGKSVRIVGRRDGLMSDAFNQRTAAVTHDGDLLMGATGGLIVIRPDRMLAPQPATSSQLIATAVEQDGWLMPLDPVPEHRKIHIDHGRRTIRIGFALTDYAAPEEVRYSYRLDDFDEHWTTIPLGTPAQATYTNLAGGRYRLRLRAEIPGIAPRMVTTAIPIIVEPMWYERWSIRAAAAAVLLIVIAGIVQLRTIVLHRRTRSLERMVDMRTQELRAANVTLAHLANTDPLTGLANRRTLMARLEAERERAARTGRGYALALIDLDLFKRVNDTYGHQAGDSVLRAVAERIAGAVRSIDCVARYGGEEIAVLFPEGSAEAALATTERLRRMIAETPIDVDGTAIAVTISGGIAVDQPGDAITAILHRADLALYQAKKAGRNRITPADALDGSTTETPALHER